MPKPLRSENPQPQDIQFRHFGVLNTGGQSKSSLFTSITLNVVLALLALIIGAATRQKIIDNRVKEATLIVPIKEEPPKPPPPKIVPPKIVPPKPPPPEPPKIVMPEVKVEPPKLPPPPVPQPPKPVPVPAMVAAPPKAVVAAAAPKPVQVNLGQSAAVPNHDRVPAAVALGRADNPIHPSNAPAVAAVNLGNRGLPGMQPGTGGGPPAQAVRMGSGQPNGSLSGSAPRAVDVGLGVKRGTGNTPGNGTQTVQAVTLARNTTPAPTVAQVTHGPTRTSPQVLYKPRPVYTAEATAMHLEGRVSVKIKVAANGAVSVVGVTSGLGHGLDESAVRAAQGIRFKPALDASGQPVDWEGVVDIVFQMA